MDIYKCVDCAKYETDYCFHKGTIDAATHNCPCFEKKDDFCVDCQIKFVDENGNDDQDGEGLV